jgi:hypothetical protein
MSPIQPRETKQTKKAKAIASVELDNIIEIKDVKLQHKLGAGNFGKKSEG